MEDRLTKLLEDQGYGTGPIDIVADPYVDDAYAVRQHRDDGDWDYVIDRSRGTIDEVMFESWPPDAGPDHMDLLNFRII